MNKTDWVLQMQERKQRAWKGYKDKRARDRDRDRKRG